MPDELYEIEQALLLEGIYRRYGYDFRQYAAASLRRRIAVAVSNEGLASLSALLERILRDPSCMERFVGVVAVHATSMFRDPEFYRAFRARVVPMLRTYPFARIWIVGCSTGEEVYSTAIALKECGIYHRCRIYATDISTVALNRAKEGIFPLKLMKDYTRNYVNSGGESEFSTYYTASYGNAIFRKSLTENVTFAQHNLTSDASFNEFNLILCRNVMLYFSKPLQEHALKLFHASLCRLGVLGIGKKETLQFSPCEDHYEEIPNGHRLFRRVK